MTQPVHACRLTSAALAALILAACDTSTIEDDGFVIDEAPRAVVTTQADDFTSGAHALVDIEAPYTTTGNLDADNAGGVMAGLSDFAKNGGAVLLVTHDEEVTARCDRVLGMKDGEIVSERAAADAPGIPHLPGGRPPGHMTEVRSGGRTSYGYTTTH